MLRPGDIIRRNDGVIHVIVRSDAKDTVLLNQFGVRHINTSVLIDRIDHKQFKIVLPIEHFCDSEKVRTKRR